MKNTKRITTRSAKSQGITILFTGPNGTGKTTAARTLTAHMASSFRYIHAARLRSRYIGETEKNLNKIFAAGSNTKTTLFFDEADALFGKRTQVSNSHDRYANQEISYLLQQLQIYPGVVILATNQKSNLNKAVRDNVNYVVQLITATGKNPRRGSTSPRSKK